MFRPRAVDGVPVATQVSSSDLVAHLYRRAGFGALPSELSAAASAGYDATVTNLVAGLTAPDPGADAIATPALSPAEPLAELRQDPAARKAYAVQRARSSSS